MTNTLRGIANPDQLAELTELISEYSKDMGINADKAG